MSKRLIAKKLYERMLLDDVRELITRYEPHCTDGTLSREYIDALHNVLDIGEKSPS